MALSNKDALQILEYASVVAHGSVTPPEDHGIVASIDGLSLKLTPLKIANVPPPMSLLQLPLEEKAIDVALSRSGGYLAVLSNSDVAVYMIDLKKRPMRAPTLVWRSEELVGACPRHVSFLGDDRVFVLTDSWDEEESTIWVSYDEQLLPKGPLLEPGKASSLITGVDFQNVFVNFQNGLVYELVTSEADTGLPIHTSLAMKMHSFAPEVKIVSVEGKVRVPEPRSKRY